jgi:PAB-dependent poly(A)-specific ribonuclease subunit 2
MGHTCEREFCLTCELAFLSHMLSQPPSAQGGSHGMSSITAQPLNFLRTLRQVREAAALGLIEGKDELEARLDQSYARRIQAFQRFILEQLHKEEGGKDGRPVKLSSSRGGGGEKNGGSNRGGAGGGGEKSGSAGGGGGGGSAAGAGDKGGDGAVCGGVETLFALSSKQTHKCAQCSREDIRPVRSFQTDLQYPSGKDQHKGSAPPPMPTFASCLANSLYTSHEVRAWCDGHQAYTRMSQTRTPTRLPQVMSINLGMRDAGDLRWWGVDTDAPITSEKGSAPVEAHWLPQYLHVCTKYKGVAVSQVGLALFTPLFCIGTQSTN